MTEERWRRFCMVGLGRHARTKLIPAILGNGQEVVGLVSGRSDDAGTGAPIFSGVSEALSALQPDTAFVLASPPTAHFSQAMEILAAGRDVIVEKPPFVTEEEARQTAEAAGAGALLIEGFMNRHTLTFRQFVRDWREAPVASVACRFTIPEVPADTFRSDPAIASSNLYDIASYFLAALIDVGLALDDFHLERVDSAGIPDRERLHLTGRFAAMRVRALIGIDASYFNQMRVTRSDGSTLSYSPFFYGRPGPRRLVRMAGGEASATVINEGNAFEAMFATPRRIWRETQPVRLRRMIELTRQLERIGKELAAARGKADQSLTQLQTTGTARRKAPQHPPTTPSLGGDRPDI